mmetsp:Transcript_34420/g.107997  ORF Transcript_34420/g.107997 Transcript_34420/m.107997 type:complete len:263 (+) Transcript_34420:71-859(+)
MRERRGKSEADHPKGSARDVCACGGGWVARPARDASRLAQLNPRRPPFVQQSELVETGCLPNERVHLLRHALPRLPLAPRPPVAPLELALDAPQHGERVRILRLLAADSAARALRGVLGGGAPPLPCLKDIVSRGVGRLRRSPCSRLRACGPVPSRGSTSGAETLEPRPDIGRRIEQRRKERLHVARGLWRRFGAASVGRVADAAAPIPPRRSRRLQEGADRGLGLLSAAPLVKDVRQQAAAEKLRPLVDGAPALVQPARQL